MKRTFLVALIWVATVFGGFAQLSDETRLIQVLQSDAPPADKEDACRRLKQIGTVKSVPALGKLLVDEHLYQSACDALETLAAAEAGQALLDALRSTSGKTRAGIIHSLGERCHRPASAELTLLLSNSDSFISTSAARALGRIGGVEVVLTLRKQLAPSTEPLRSSVVDALLDCAGQLLAAGDRNGARAIYAQFTNAKEEEIVRTAAYIGMIRSAASESALELVMTGLTSNDAAAQTAALRLAAEVQASKATGAFTNLLPKASPPLQIALLRLLQQRGDDTAAPAVFMMAQSQDATVRVAAIAALGTLGDATAASLLANSATSHEEAEQRAARQALTELRRGDVAGTMIAALPSASPEVQMELMRALATRMDKASAPGLLEVARTGDPATRRMALRGLEQLADDSHLPALVNLLQETNAATTRADIQSVFESLADRTPSGKELDVAAIVQGLGTTDVPTRIALLQVSAFYEDAKLREAFRAGLKDTNVLVRAAAERALCKSRDGKLLPELQELARSAGEENLRALALEGVVRMIGESDASLPVSRRVQLLKSAYGLATRAEEKRLVLSALANAPNLESLQAAERALGENGLKAEAEVACARIAKELLATEPTAATTCLRRLAEQGSTTNVQANARSTLKQFDSGWLYAGPHGRKGLEATALFDVAFAPERQEVEWRRAPGTADLSRPGEVELLSIANREHCVVYLKTRVFVPVTQPVHFEIGSDDGIKLWVNGKLVHTNNTVRGLTPGEDRVTGTLRQGWNELFAKVTQATAGCSLMLNLRQPDGSEIPRLQFDPSGEARAAGFKRIQLSDQFLAEGAYYGDFNRDGKLDVVAGPYWFAGPDFQQRYEIRPPGKFDPQGYSDNFLTYTADFNADGWQDVFYVPFPGTEGYWYENPRGKPGHWPRRLAYSMVGNESPGWMDMNGDGRADLIFNNEGFLGYATYDPSSPNEMWTFHAVSAKDNRFQRFTHGIGAGDINGDGRMDLLEAGGWWEQPLDDSTAKPWKSHPHKFADAAAQMLATDVDGDGLTDIINSWHCHLYGLIWHRQLREAGGEIKWEQNVILPPAPDLNLLGVRFSQPHAMELADMNGDGLKDIVTGKRYWAHGPAGDVEPDAPAVLYWFELQRVGGKASFAPHLIDDDSGVGTQVTTTDLNADGKRDVVVANKKGLYLHLAE